MYLLVKVDHMERRNIGTGRWRLNACSNGSLQLQRCGHRVVGKADPLAEIDHSKTRASTMVNLQWWWLTSKIDTVCTGTHRCSELPPVFYQSLVRIWDGKDNVV